MNPNPYRISPMRAMTKAIARYVTIDGIYGILTSLGIAEFRRRR